MWELHNNATELYSQIKVKTVSFTLYDFYCNKKNFFNQSGLQLLLFCKFILLLFLGFTEAFYKLQPLSGCQKKKERFFCSTVITTSNRRLPNAPLQLWMHKQKWWVPYHAPPSWGKMSRHVRVLLVSYSPPPEGPPARETFKFLSSPLKEKKDFPGDSECRESACKAWDLGWEDPLEEGMATDSSILAWEIPWTEEAAGLQSMGLQRSRQKEKMSSYSHTGLYNDKSTQRPCVNSSSPKDNCPSSGSAGPQGSNHWAQKVIWVHTPRWLSITTQDKQCPKRLFVTCHILFCGSVTKLCPTLYDLMDCSPPGSSVLFTNCQFPQIQVQWVSDAI